MPSSRTPTNTRMCLVLHLGMGCLQTQKLIAHPHQPRTKTMGQDIKSAQKRPCPRLPEAAKVPRRGNSTTSSHLISLADLSWPLYHLREIGAQVFRRPIPSTKRRLGPYNANSQSSKPKDTSSNPVKICPHQTLGPDTGDFVCESKRSSSHQKIYVPSLRGVN